VATLFNDLRYALRVLLKSPGFTMTAILTLALGIGAVTAVFSVVNSVILRPYAFRDPGQLVIWREIIQEVSNRYPVIPDNYKHYLNLKAHSTKIEDAAILQNASFPVSAGDSHPEIVKGLSVSDNFFAVLGATPVLGRTFSSDEMRKGRNQVVILSWAAWRRFFNEDAAAVGKSLKVGGELKTVVGVLPSTFTFPTLNEMPTSAQPGEVAQYEIFQPLVPQDEELTADDSDFSFLVVARLKPGVTAQQAGSELDGMQKSYSANNHLAIHLGAFVEPLSQEVTGNVSKGLWLLFAAVSGVLLIACVNLAGLQLARSVVRDRDNALRAALGAGPRRLFQTALSESLILSTIGGAAGILFAFAGVRVFVAVAPANLPRLNEVHVSWPILFFAAGLSILTAIAFGTLPSLRSVRINPQQVLQSGSSRISGVRKATDLRRILVAFEVSCTVVLLTLSALIVRSFSNLINEDHAFNSGHLVVAEVNLLDARYNRGGDVDNATRSAFVDRALARLRSIPGVQVAAITSSMPLTGESNVYGISREDHPLPEAQLPTANLRNVTPGYFEALQIPMIDGEDFKETERDHPQDGIISQSTAQVAWPGESPLGRNFRINGRTYRVIGIVADARIVDLKKNAPVVYLPYWHDPPSAVFFLVRSVLPVKTLAPSIRSEFWSVDPEVAIPVLKSLDTQVAESLGSERFQALVLSCFSVAALMLAGLGVYGVLAYSVSLRMHEFGIRIALGSSKKALIRLVLQEASYPVLVGVTVGLLVAVGATSAIRSLLYETRTVDPFAIGMSVGLLVLAAIVAGLGPAYRASSSDPIRALREQ
jgi:predicted permease